MKFTSAELATLIRLVSNAIELPTADTLKSTNHDYAHLVELRRKLGRAFDAANMGS